MNEQYLMILLDSLKKKNDILDEILRISMHQSEILAEEPLPFEAFDRCVDDKDICIERMNQLDEGFESLYQRVKQELEDNKQSYAKWIADCQQQIGLIMDKSVEIQALEARNKQSVENALKRERKDFSKGKRSVEVAKNYYRSVNNTSVIPPHFMDQKK